MTNKTINTSSRGVFQSIDQNRGFSTPLQGKVSFKTTPRKGKHASRASMTTASSTTSQKREFRAIDNNEGSANPIQTKDSARERAAEPSKDEMKARFDTVCRARVGGEDIEGVDIQEWTLDDFELVKKLGTGGTANVYCAREVQSGYQVALKVQQDDEDGLCEIDIHLPLEHPNIVRMIDYFFCDSSFEPEAEDEYESDDEQRPKRYLYIIMELCDGGSLHDFIGEDKNCCLNEKRAAAFFKNALDALEYLHERDVIHCDCKPANFLVHGGKLKLADFGMAVHEDEKEIIGATPVYMAPEHLLAWRHMTNNFDKRSDIYSLGVVLYEMILGYLPFEVFDAEDSDEDSFSKDGIGNNSMSSSTEALLNKFPKLNIGDDDEDFETPVLDLRKLNDQSADEPFYIPPPIFPPDVSEEAQDLILKLMEPSLKKRISISDAKNHPWFRKQLQST